MNRPIKFRAWDKERGLKGEMLKSDQVMRIEFGKDGIDWLGGWVVEADNEGDPTQALHQIPNKNLILMQFTGLKDKNGKEIWEGDVVYLAGYGNYQVEFPFIQLYEAGQEKDIGEVIGNIYENPELLNNKN